MTPPRASLHEGAVLRPCVSNAHGLCGSSDFFHANERSALRTAGVPPTCL